MLRRKFITNTIRASILGGIGIMSGVLLTKKKTSASCQYIYLCKGCNKVTDCQLDEAVEFRNNLKIR